jgi:hypothetical protein
MAAQMRLVLLVERRDVDDAQPLGWAALAERQALTQLRHA